MVSQTENIVRDTPLYFQRISWRVKLNVYGEKESSTNLMGNWIFVKFTHEISLILYHDIPLKIKLISPTVHFMNLV